MTGFAGLYFEIERKKAEMAQLENKVQSAELRNVRVPRVRVCIFIRCAGIVVVPFCQQNRRNGHSPNFKNSKTSPKFRRKCRLIFYRAYGYVSEKNVEKVFGLPIELTCICTSILSRMKCLVFGLREQNCARIYLFFVIIYHANHGVGNSHILSSTKYSCLVVPRDTSPRPV